MTTLPYVRIDCLPENLDYRDTGCSLHPACLTCPFETCRYDDPMRSQRSRSFGQETAKLAAEGMRPHQIAAKLNVSRRTVFRHLALARRGL